MKISFTEAEIYEWLDVLDRLCDPCTDADVKDYQKIVKKLKNAEIRSSASRSKIRFVHAAQDKKQREHDSEVRESFAKALRDSKKVMV